MQPGTKLSSYEILSPLGKGGMGEVWRARDSKLGREVAIKTLPEEFAKDEERLARFEREAKLLASLNHPNIATIHGLEEDNGTRFLILELVEGDTLADWLKRGAIPVEESLKLALQIAEALEAAHEKGVIHRDLKPANIKVTPDGKIKVLDFGLAKAFASDGADESLSQSPTLSLAATQQGMILGTAAYMSPEQARGKEVDKRTDIWAFGCVVYEMLTGQRAFAAEDVSLTLAAVLRGEVHWKALPSDLSPTLRLYLTRCLEREPKQRIPDMADMRLALEGAFDTGGDLSASTPDVGRPNRLTVGMTVLAAMFAVGLGWSLLRPVTEPLRSVARFELPFRDGQAPTGWFELTRDGSALIYVGPAETGGASQLWMRSWNELEARPIPGTAGLGVVASPLAFAVSPDGREVAFAQGFPGPLWVVPVDGGPGRKLAESATYASWSDDGWIYFTDDDLNRAISRVSVPDSELETVTQLAEGDSVHIPHPMPGGKVLLYTVARDLSGSDAAIWSMDLGTSERKMLTPGTLARYAASAHLLFGSPDGQLMAQPFDVTRAEFTGNAVPMVDGLTTGSFRSVAYSVSADGSLVYSAGGSFDVREFVWVTRSGEPSPVSPGETLRWVGQGPNHGLRLSPDGSRVAFTDVTDGNVDIWTKVLPDGPTSRLTTDENPDQGPAWTPNSREITFASMRASPNSVGLGQRWRVWRRPANLTAEAEFLYGDPDSPGAEGVWSPDGWLVVRRNPVPPEHPTLDIIGLRPGEDGEAEPLVVSEKFNEWHPAVSRDGRWLAYVSNETGRAEVFVQPFPNVIDGRWQISSGGGLEPVWAHNGRELFFRNRGNEIAVATFSTTGNSFDLGSVTPLFRMQFDIGDNSDNDARVYDVAPDDQSFLMTRPVDTETAATSVILVQNFFEELKRQVPTDN